ncbi:MAG: hypothetical protein ABJC09_00450 [Terriglobia bacterium]
MNCPCDTIVFPQPLTIAAGLDELPLQFATFPEFRTAMLDAITREPALSIWRARSSDDFGIMLLEMWAYVCDSIAFYRETIGNEQYVRTSQLRPSLRKLVDLLGYIPRPASSATVDLVALADGRQPLILPPGTAFRSGAFPGGTPQVFELDAPTKIHPLLNKWTLNRSRPQTIDSQEGFPLINYSYAWALPSAVSVKAGGILVVATTNGVAAVAATVTSITDFPAQDGVKYKQINWSPSLALSGSIPIANVQFTKPTQKGGLWKQAVQSGDGPVISGTSIVLDGLYRGIAPGSMVVLQNGANLRWFRCYTSEQPRKLAKGGDITYTDPVSKNSTTISPPFPLTTVTVLTLDADVNAASRRGGYGNWGSSEIANIVLHYAFVTAAQVTNPFFTTLIAGDPLGVQVPAEPPADGSSSNEFMLEDKNGVGLEITGSLDFLSGTVTLGQSSSISKTLIVPVTMYGNIVTASRGETVPSEFLGAGDASVEYATFTLKKKPLTYTPSATAGNETGVASSLKIWVNGLLWSETPSFFGHPVEDQVYTVRQNDNAEAVITFNGRLSTGVPIVASYRFGGGSVTPPAGSISQIAKAVKGLKSVRNPVAASGGADAEAASNLSANAPKSALLLGRAVSIDDMQVAAANIAGVRAVQAEWRWNMQNQRPVVQIWYVGEAGVQKNILQTLQNLSDPTTPFSVDEALPVSASLSISVETDPRRVAVDVATAVSAALMDKSTGLLSPERIGIGKTLFRSVIFETVLQITGAIAVDGLLWSGKAFPDYGINPGSGKYFDFENGILSVNGEADSHVAAS